MQRSPVEIKRRLLSALDRDNNVVDLALVLEIMATLEQMHITKEALETTRLGKHINEMRKKTQDVTLARRAKALVRRWRDMILPPSEPTAAPAVVAVPRRCSPPSHSCPSSASTSPGLPTTGRQPPSKSDIANKRKRKLAECWPPGGAARPRLNGAATGVEDECSRDSITCEINPARACSPPTIDLCGDDDSAPVPPPLAKKSRRSRSATSNPSFADLNEKLASKSRRVKTTRELLSDMAERSGDSALARRASQFPERPPPPAAAAPVPMARRSPAVSGGRRSAGPGETVEASKGLMMARYLTQQKPEIARSTCSPTPSGQPPGTASSPATTPPTVTVGDEPVVLNGTRTPPSSPPSPPDPPRVPALPTVAEILARLPPLDESAIVWQEEEQQQQEEETGGDSHCSSSSGRVPVVPAHQAHRLSREQLQNVTGNRDWRGEFREWHEVVVMRSHAPSVSSTAEDEQSQYSHLPMLPYVIID